MDGGNVMLRQAFGPLVWNRVKPQSPAGERVVSLDSRIVTCRQDVGASQVAAIILPGTMSDEVVEQGLPGSERAAVVVWREPLNASSRSSGGTQP